MKKNYTRVLTLLFVLMMTIGLCIITASAQQEELEVAPVEWVNPYCSVWHIGNKYID